MATPVTTSKPSGSKEPPKNGLVLIWLDDHAEEDPNAKAIFLALFEQVFTFTDPGRCLEFVESAEIDTPCISILVSGKYGQMLVRDRFQPLKQIKDIYVYCFDIAKHTQWAQECDKVRCVESDFGTIYQRMQQYLPKVTKQTQPLMMEEVPIEEPVPEEPERFIDDNNLYDQLALDVVLKSADDDGLEDFKTYCQTNEAAQEEQFKPNVPIKEWFKRELVFLQLNSTDLSQLWTFRWFIRLFYRQLTKEYEAFIQNQTNFTAFFSTWLDADELDGMKHRIGGYIIFTELILAYGNDRMALDTTGEKKSEQSKYKILFEINVDRKMKSTIPYAEIDNDQMLFWFGSRYRLKKIEVIEDEKETYWIISLNLISTLENTPSLQTLYEFYLKNLLELNDLHHAFGRIMIYKGLYSQADQWLQTTNHFEDLAEIAIRQHQAERAHQHLERLPEDSNHANLLRAYANLILSSDNIGKARGILMKICSEADDRLVRARANLALGFISLIVTQQGDQAFDYFKLGNDNLRKILPDIHPDIAKSFLGLGYTHFLRHDINEAEKQFQLAFQIQKQALTFKHPDIAKTRNGRAHCLSTQKQTVKQALKEMEYALQILLKTFPKEYKTHPEILLTINDMERVRKGKELRARNTILDYI